MFLKLNNFKDEGTRSAFRPVGQSVSSGGVVNSPAVKPGTAPLLPDRSPHVNRRHMETSSDQDTVSPTPSSTASESQPPTPAIHEVYVLFIF